MYIVLTLMSYNSLILYTSNTLISYTSTLISYTSKSMISYNSLISYTSNTLISHTSTLISYTSKSREGAHSSNFSGKEVGVSRVQSTDFDVLFLRSWRSESCTDY